MATTFDTPIVNGNLMHGVRRLAAIVLGLACCGLGLALALALLGHYPDDPSWNQAIAGPVRNPLGGTGAGISDVLYQGFGVAAWLLPLAALAWGIRFLIGQSHPYPFVPLNALPLALLAGAAHLATVVNLGLRPDGVMPGGLVGYELWSRFAFSIGDSLYASLTLGVAVVLSIVALGLRPTEAFAVALALPRRLLGLGGAIAARRGRRRSGETDGDDERQPRRGEPDNEIVSRLGGLLSGLRQSSGSAHMRRRQAEMHDDDERFDEDGDDDSAPAPMLDAYGTPPAPVPNRRQPVPPVQLDIEDEVPSKRRAKQRTMDDGSSSLIHGPQGADGFRLPGFGLLSPVKPGHRADIDPVELEMMSRELERVLEEFGIRGQIVDAKPGPVVTLFELEPAPGTRAARVVNLSEDIARSLSALSVRVAIVRGRNVIGIELPNPVRDTVYLKEILAGDAASNPKIKLGICLGKDISGEPIIADLARMPHLLIAGTTGSGKSVSINAMILSLLYRHTPSELKMIMIDPKVIELSVYDGIPHLLAPVVTEPAKAVVALKWAVRQMDHRYRQMSHLGVRDIHAYNRRLADAAERSEELTRRVQVGYDSTSGLPQFEEQPIDMTPLPQVVIIVDEVADLMLTAGKEVEAQIQRLSQKARAAGIHLIVATQRPSVDVLTGVIKANMPSRVSFRVSSKIDSRTILGEPGAEQLLGQGDMLYLMSPEPPQRVHGPLVTDAEVERVVDHLKSQGQPEYLDAVTSEEQPAEATATTGSNIETGDAEDQQYQEALQIVATDQRATTSFLQRKMRIGYNTAARLIERMQEDGYISTADHVGRRQILIGGDQSGDNL